jgi:hypothetical protein
VIAHCEGGKIPAYIAGLVIRKVAIAVGGQAETGGNAARGVFRSGSKKSFYVGNIYTSNAN